MTKVTARGSAKIADVKSGFEPKLSGSVTLVNALDNGVKVRGVISDKAIKTSSLSGCSLGLEKPGSLSAVYSFDSKTTKVTVFGKSTVQDKAVKGKISYNQKGDAWTGQATVDLSDSTSLTATYDLKDKSATIASDFTLSGIDLSAEYGFNNKAVSLSASKDINGIPMSAEYDFSSKDITLQAKFDPATVKVTTTAAGGSAIGIAVSTSKTFSV